MTTLPSAGRNRAEIFESFDEFGKDDLDWRNGRCFAYVFTAGDEVYAIARDAYTRFMTENALDPTSFPSLMRMENEVVSMTSELLHSPSGVGNFTSGGTESILLAMKAARDWGRAEKGIERPKVIVASSVHPAFFKAGHYFGIDLVAVPVGRDFRADSEAMKAAIDDDTVMLVGSAPAYAQGVIDPIAELGAIASERGLLLHVDACVGGFFLPFLERAGQPVPPFDFRVEGVTSLSVDLHKYGYCPKGASLVLYRDAELRKHQLFAHTKWAGYGLTNATIQSSRSGGAVAAAWAVLNSIGDAGYRDLQTSIRASVLQLCEGINGIDGLDVLGEPHAGLLSFSSSAVDVYAIVDGMRARDWYVQPQFGYGNTPRSIHLTVTPPNVGKEEALLGDLAEVVEGLKTAAANAPADDPLTKLVAAFVSGQLSMEQALASLGGDPSSLGKTSAPINRVLDALPNEQSEELLRAYFNLLYRGDST